MRSFSCFILFAAFSIAFLPAFAQEKPKANPEGTSEILICPVEFNPEFPGGNGALMKFLLSKLQNTDMTNKPEGLVILQFEVTETGELKDFTIVKTLEPSLDIAALIAVKQMPNWIPASQNGIPVKVRFTLPVRFSKIMANHSKEKRKGKHK